MPNEFSPSDVLLQEKIAQLEKRAAEHEQKNEPEKAKEFRDKANELRSLLKQIQDKQRQKADEERQKAANKISIEKQHNVAKDIYKASKASIDGTKERLQIEKDHNHKIETKKFADVSKEVMKATQKAEATPKKEEVAQPKKDGTEERRKNEEAHHIAVIKEGQERSGR
jgi:hypothetical protein